MIILFSSFGFVFSKRQLPRNYQLRSFIPPARTYFSNCRHIVQPRRSHSYVFLICDRMWLAFGVASKLALKAKHSCSRQQFFRWEAASGKLCGPAFFSQMYLHDRVVAGWAQPVRNQTIWANAVPRIIRTRFLASQVHCVHREVRVPAAGSNPVDMHH